MMDAEELVEEENEKKEPALAGADKKPAKRDKVYKDDEELDDTIFIRNVARFDTTQESLKAHMESNWGETVYCLLCKDRETGESRGTAFVKFKDPESAGMCLGDFEDREMQQKFFLDGRNLFVLPALNRNQMGEVRKASAKKEEAPKEKKVKKPRWYRTPVRKDSNGQTATSEPVQRKSSDNSKGKKTLKPVNRSKKDQRTGKGGPRRRDQDKGKPGAASARKGKGRAFSAHEGRKPESKGRAQNKKAMGTGKKMKKTKKVKRNAG